MDRFIAMIATGREPVGREWLDLLTSALHERPPHAQPVAQSTWAGDRLAFACATRVSASDAALATPEHGPLIYVDGPVANLRRDLQPERTRAEAYAARLATIARAAERWIAGEPEWTSLSGSFSGLAHLPAAGRTLVFTDRLASRPVFYTRTAEHLWIASDLQALLNLPGRRPTLDLDAVAQLLRYQMILDDRTLCTSINVIAPGTIIDIDHRRELVTFERYWSFAAQSPFPTQQEAITATAQAFEAATNRIVADSQQLAIFLSGGFDSRMLLASLSQEHLASAAASTFGPLLTHEATVARQVANTSGVPWHFIQQPLDQYWRCLPENVYASNGLHSAGHMHLYHPAALIAEHGYDTILNGWGFDLPYSGSYLPKESFKLLGRELYTYRLGQLRTPQDVTNYLHTSLDLHAEHFAQSLLGSRMRERWAEVSYTILAEHVTQAAEQSAAPYDWIDFALFGNGIAKFRSYGMLMGVRAQVRERNPLFESDILDVYQRLPYQWRFLGPVFRRAVRQLSPELAAISYSNIGVSAFAPPMVQALTLQARAAWRANRDRVQKLGHQIGVAAPPSSAKEQYGSYLHATEMATYLEADGEISRSVHALLTRGPLVQGGILDPAQLPAALARCSAGSSKAGFTLMAWTALALWLDRYHVDLPQLN